MRAKLLGWLMVSLLVTGLSGCTTDDARLKSAIATKLSTEGNPLVCAAVLNDVGRFPFNYHADGMLNHGANKKTLDKLAELGFLSARPVLVQSIYGGMNGEKVGSPQATEYSLTPLGSKYNQNNKFCVPNEMAETDVEADGSRRTLLVTQYFAVERNAETERLISALAEINPSLPLLLEKDLPLRFTVRTSAKADILSVQSAS